MQNMTSHHRGIPQGSAFCWLYKAWVHGDAKRGIEPLLTHAHVVEVGCGPCHSLGYLLDIAPKTWTITSVDPYYGEGRFRDWVRTCYEKLGDVVDRVQFLRWPSPDVCALFKPQSVDAVMIDGDHDYEPVVRDIAAWRTKVKPGGYLAGDDVDPDFPGCERAWDEAFPGIRVYGSTAVVRL
jgi:hypothetical protein